MSDLSKKDEEKQVQPDPKTQGSKVVWPSILKVRELRPWVDQVLKAIGYPAALVTDLSSLGDFPLELEDYKLVEKDLGFPVSREDRLVDVALKLKNLIQRSHS
jgi:hypothetical protein